MSGRITVPAASVIPQGVGAPPPPGLDPKKGKLMCIKVRMLDDTVGVFHLGHKAMGRALFDEVCRHLNLLECDYFGLEFLDITGNRCWLDKEKSILRQITAARSDARFYFVVKFYPPNPTDLEEEYTRYLFALQVKRDLASGQFVVNENTAALMASYIVQSECGDYCSEDYPDHTYLSAVRFIPNQSSEFEKQVMENHKKLIGVSPAESDLNLLETARRAEFYGIKFHPAKDIEGTAVSLCVVHLGIKVYHQLTCANTFSWAKIRKLSFKRRKFLIKLHPESYAYYKDTIEFLFDNRNECKMFWKKCIEHHSFFRCSQMANQSCKQYSKLFPRGSSFRYSGRTHQQLIDYIREHHRRREPFTRPVHSSYNRSAYDDRSLPTPMIPTSHQNGGSGNGAAAQARINGRRGPKSAQMNAADSSLVEDGGSAVAPGSFQGQPSRRKPKGAAARAVTPGFRAPPTETQTPLPLTGASADDPRRRSSAGADPVLRGVAPESPSLTGRRRIYENFDPSRPSPFRTATAAASVPSVYRGAVSARSFLGAGSLESTGEYYCYEDGASDLSFRSSDNEGSKKFVTVRRVAVSCSAESVATVSGPTGSGCRGLAAPLSGRVIAKIPVITAKPKPVAPPKPERTTGPPTVVTSNSLVLSKSSLITKITEISSKADEPMAKPVPDEKKPVSPEKPAKPKPPPPPRKPIMNPPVIEIDSEEHPDVRHKIINGDIPYILHVRDISKGGEPTVPGRPTDAYCTFSLPSANRAGGRGSRGSADPSTRDFSTSCNSLNHRRSRSAKTRRELVPRKRLPSPANFSSQDHSISPEFERSTAVPAVGPSRLTGKRGDPRRMTQPVFPVARPPEAPQRDVGSTEEVGKSRRTDPQGVGGTGTRSQPCFPTSASTRPGDSSDDDSDEGSRVLAAGGARDRASSSSSLENLEKAPAPSISDDDDEERELTAFLVASPPPSTRNVKTGEEPDQSR